MFEACCECSLTAAPRPIQGPLERCACCLQQHDGEEHNVEDENVCVVCGLGPMCSGCTWLVPYRCCKCLGAQTCWDAKNRRTKPLPNVHHLIYVR